MPYVLCTFMGVVLLLMTLFAGVQSLVFCFYVTLFHVSNIKSMLFHFLGLYVDFVTLQGQA